MTTVNPDIENILSEPTEIELTNGMKVEVQRLKTIQMLRLLRIFTRGIGENIGAFSFDPEDPDFAQNIVMLAFLAIPEAEQETVDFVQSMVVPVGYNERAKTKEEREKNDELYAEFLVAMRNPEIDDLFSIVEVAIKNEVPHLTALGKRVATLLQAQQKSVTAKRGAAKGKTPTEK